MDVELAGVAFHALTEEGTVGRVRSALARGEGGRILTPNVDILRQDPGRYAADASLVVADGMPLVWASRLAGTSAAARRSTSSPATGPGHPAGCSATGWSGCTGWVPSRAGWQAGTWAGTRPMRRACWPMRPPVDMAVRPDRRYSRRYDR